MAGCSCDLEDRSGWRNVLSNGLAFIAARVWELKTFRGLTPWKLRREYRRHGRNETYLAIGEVERVAREELPGSHVRSHLVWRYSIVWDRP